MFELDIQGGIVRARNAGVVVERSNHYEAFWQVLADNLMNKYGVKPVHSLQEIELLQERFPQNIQLYQAVREG